MIGQTTKAALLVVSAVALAALAAGRLNLTPGIPDVIPENTQTTEVQIVEPVEISLNQIDLHCHVTALGSTEIEARRHHSVSVFDYRTDRIVLAVVADVNVCTEGVTSVESNTVTIDWSTLVFDRPRVDHEQSRVLHHNKGFVGKFTDLPIFVSENSPLYDVAYFYGQTAVMQSCYGVIFEESRTLILNSYRNQYPGVDIEFIEIGQPPALDEVPQPADDISVTATKTKCNLEES